MLLCLGGKSQLASVWKGRPGGTSGKEPAGQCQRRKRCGFHPWVGRSPGGGHSNPPQCSRLENPIDGRTWWATVHGAVKESDRTEPTYHTQGLPCGMWFEAVYRENSSPPVLPSPSMRWPRRAPWPLTWVAQLSGSSALRGPSLGDIRHHDRAPSTQPEPSLLTCRSPFPCDHSATAGPTPWALQPWTPRPWGGSGGGRWEPSERLGKVLTPRAGNSCRGWNRDLLCGQQRPRRGQAISKKNKVSLEMDCKATAVKTGSAQGQSTEQWDRVQSPEINCQAHRQLISRKGTGGTHWGKVSLPHTWRCWEVSTHGREGGFKRKTHLIKMNQRPKWKTKSIKLSTRTQE